MMIMKNINDRNSCPMAGEVEGLLNTVRPSSVHFEELLKRYPERILKDFFISCILCWADYGRFDDRNIRAVLVSREIVSYFKTLNDDVKDRRMLDEASGFVLFAHRAIHQHLFEVICLYLKNTGYKGIAFWLDRKAFVIDRTFQTAVPSGR